MEVKKVSETIITKVIIETTEITDDINHVRTTTNDTQVVCRLDYKGDFFLRRVEVLYNPDLEVLKRTNPNWGEYKWFKTPIPNNPEDIDINKIVYSYYWEHSFFDVNLEPIPVVIMGDYVEARLSNKYYNLEALKDYLNKHPNVIQCSEILDMPYYSVEKGGNKYLKILVLPEKNWITERIRDDLFNIWRKSCPDYLGLKKFAKYEEI